MTAPPSKTLPRKKRISANKRAKKETQPLSAQFQSVPSVEHESRQAQVEAQILAQYLKDLSFESPNAPQVFTTATQTQPQFSLKIQITPRQVKKLQYEVSLTLIVSMKRGEVICFLVEICYAGLVRTSIDLLPPFNSPALLVDVPRLLFPYARNILSEVTQSSGFPPLVIQPVDFLALYKQNLESATEFKGTHKGTHEA